MTSCDVFDTAILPTGTGLARGFLGAVDAAWMIRPYAANKPPLQLPSEQESVYQLLSQTTPDKLGCNKGIYYRAIIHLITSKLI